MTDEERERFAAGRLAAMKAGRASVQTWPGESATGAVQFVVQQLGELATLLEKKDSGWELEAWVLRVLGNVLAMGGLPAEGTWVRQESVPEADPGIPASRVRGVLAMGPPGHWAESEKGRHLVEGWWEAMSAGAVAVAVGSACWQERGGMNTADDSLGTRLDEAEDQIKGLLAERDALQGQVEELKGKLVEERSVGAGVDHR